MVGTDRDFVGALNLPPEYVPVDADGRNADMIANLLGAAQTYATDCGAFEQRVRACVDALVAVRRVAWAASDRRETMRGMFATATGTPDAERLDESREQDISRLAVSEYGASANAAADAAANALRGLEDALGAGRKKQELASLTIPDSMLARVPRIERELVVRAPAVNLDVWEAAVASSDPLCPVLAIVMSAYAKNELGTDPVMRRARSPRLVATGDIDKESAVLRGLLGSIEAWRREQVDPALLLASKIFASCLIPAYRALAGLRTVWDLPKTSWSVQASSGAVPDWSERLDSWLTRYWPYGTVDYKTADATTIAKRGTTAFNGPPGWSPRRRTPQGLERVKLQNLVGDPKLAMKGAATLSLPPKR